MNFSVYNRDDEYSRQLSKTLRDVLSMQKGWLYSEKDPELVICVGGDGTLLRAVHYYLHSLENIVFTAIHTGTLGFFTDYTKDEVLNLLSDVLDKSYKIETSNLLQIHMNDCEEPIYALNELRLGSFTKTLEFDVFIDGELFEHTTGSGICISTQAGSTAANRALMGAVVDDGLEVLQLCEIMPVAHQKHHSLRNPYIMRSDRTITIQGDSLEDAEICFDHLVMDNTGLKKLEISTAEKQIRFARFKPYSYLKRLKNLY